MAEEQNHPFFKRWFWSKDGPENVGANDPKPMSGSGGMSHDKLEARLCEIIDLIKEQGARAKND